MAQYDLPMRYRQLSPCGDYMFGQGSANFLVNSPAGVAQAIQTRLLLFKGTYFLDLTQGMDWDNDVLGFNTASLYDQAIQNQVLGTQGVTSLASYSSSFDSVTRVLTVTGIASNIYGEPVGFTVPIPTSGYGITPYGDDYGDPS